jgi:predicted nucleic acid-binding protein
MRYLLDTNIVSDLVRNPQGKVAQHIRKVGEAQVFTSIIVAAELRYGAAKRRSPRLSAQSGSGARSARSFALRDTGRCCLRIAAYAA